MSLDPSYVGKKLLCGECGHRFVVTPDMQIRQTLRDRHGKVIGATLTCDKCGQDVFVVPDPPTRRKNVIRADRQK